MAPRDPDFEIDEDDDGNKTVTLPADQATNLREKARKADENATAAAERDVALRKLAMRDAGIPKGVLGEMFEETYKGELTAEAITEAASKIPGLIAEAAQPAVEKTPEEIEAARIEAEQTGARQALAQGNTNAGVLPDRDPRELAAEAVAKARADGRSEEVALSAGLRELVSAAANGDRRVRLRGFGDSGE